MGHTISLQVNRGGKATGGDRDNSIMLRMEKELDVFASEMEIAPPSRFYNTWGDSAVGHQTITAILGMLRDQPGRFPFPNEPSRQHWRDQLLEELSHCEAELRAAAEAGHQFRFRIVA